MEKTVGQLVYEIVAKIDGTFNTTIKSAENTIEGIGKASTVADSALEQLRKQSIEVTKSFMEGKIGFTDYQKQLNAIAENKKAFTSFDNLSKTQQQLVKDLDKGKITLEEFNRQMAKSGDVATKTNSIFKDLFKFELLRQAVSFAVNFGKQSVQAFANAQQSTIQFNNALQNVGGTTKEQINDLDEYIRALETKTSVDDKSIRQAAQVYAQDQIRIENIKKLIDGTLDLAVANAKANGAEIDLQGTATAVGRALATGELGALTRQNIVGIDAQTESLFKLGNQSQRTAILQKLFADNAKGAGEALGNSLQGRINSAKDAYEDLQVSLGKGLTVAFTNLGLQLTNTSTGLEAVKNSGRVSGTIMVALSSAVALVVNMFRAMGISIAIVANRIISFGEISFATAKDVVKNFQNAGKAVTSVGDAIKAVADGDFKGAKDKLKDAFNITFDTTNRDNAKKFAEDTSNALQKQFDDIGVAIGKNELAIIHSGKVYDETAKAVDEYTKAQDSKKKAVAEATIADAQAIQKAQELQDKIQGIAKSAITAGEALQNKLTESLKKFGTDIASNYEDTNSKLADIIANAEKKKLELQAQATAGTDVTAQLAEVQKTLDARVGYEQRAQDRIDAIKKQAKDAGLDVNALGLDNLIKGQQTFEESLKQSRQLASANEFTRFELESAQKLQKIAENAIAELVIEKNKIDTQKKYTEELTAFAISQGAKQQTAVTNFANNAIIKYKEVADALRSVITLQSQLGTTGGNPKLPQFHDGGFVGTNGGEVHAGEFVIPADLVRSMPNLVSQLDSLRNGGQVNNIQITANGNGTADFDTVAQNLAWRLGRL